MKDKVCGKCLNIRKDSFRDKLFCVFNDADYYKGRKTNETKRYWQDGCNKFCEIPTEAEKEIENRELNYNF